MTPEEFRHPSVEQLSGINMLFEEGLAEPAIVGPGHPAPPRATASDSFYQEFDEADESEQPPKTS
jgi:hypothetical protein